MDDEHEQEDKQAAYELSEPFNIDDGELNGCSPQECFCLGVEWAWVGISLDHGRAFERPLHMDNTDRVELMCKRRGRDYSIETMNEDWAWLKVEAM